MAVWTEPSVPAPGSSLDEPILGGSDQTKAGSLELTGGATANGPSAGSGQFNSGIRGIGSYLTLGTVSAGVYGAASASFVPSDLVTDPFQVGVYGNAGADASTAVGVYGDAAGFTNSWAGFFQGGSTGFWSGLELFGSAGNLTAPFGLSINSEFGDGLAIATSVTTGKAGVYGSYTVDGSPGGEGFGVLGTLDGGIPNCTTANCSAVLGADTDAYTLTAGKFGGYFVGNVHITDRLYINGRLTAPPVTSNDYALYAVPGLATQQPGSLQGLESQTGAVGYATGGVTSTGDYLIVTDYLGADNDIARVNPVTLKPDSAADVVTMPNAAQQVTYDGQSVWVRDKDTLRKLSGQTFAELGNWTFTSGTALSLGRSQPFFSGQGVYIGSYRVADNANFLSYVSAGGTGTTYAPGASGCAPIKSVLRLGTLGFGASKLWMALPSACSTPVPDTSIGYATLDGNGVPLAGGTNLFTNQLQSNGRAAGIAYDGTDLWMSAESNFYAAGDARNKEVHLLRITPTWPTTIQANITLSGTVGYTSGPVVFDGTAIWVAASTWGNSGFGYDGKLFRVPLTLASGSTVLPLDRSTTAVGASPIQDLYFDGSDIYLYGNNPGASPHINYYLEKRSR